MNFSDLLKTAVRNTFRSKLRTTLTIIAIFIGAFTLTITTAIGTGVSRYIDAQIGSIGSPGVLSIVKTPDATTSASDGPAKYDPAEAGAPGGPSAPGQTFKPLTPADLATIRNTAGIIDVNPTVSVNPSYIEYGSHGKYQLTLNTAAALTKADLAAGSQLTETGNSNGVLLPISYLHNLGFGDAQSAVGKTVTIGISDYLGIAHALSATVVGVQNTTLIGGGVGLNQHLTDELSTIESTGKPANISVTYGSATAHFDPNASTAQIDTLKKALAREGFTGQTVADQIGTFQTVISGIIGVLDAFAVIALIAAGFGIINTLLMSVQERTREIGLMKAMGMSGRKVFALFSFEAVFIGFLGSAIGAGVAIAVGSLISSVLANTVLSGLPGLHVLQFAPASVIGIILVVMLIAFLAGTLPARRAARQNPIDALRYE